MYDGILADTVNSLRVGDPLFCRNLTVFPLTDGEGHPTSLATFAEALEQGTAAVSELDVPTVEEIMLDNRGDEPLFLLDGEEIFGAQQTRVTTTAALVEARSRTPVPVACIEEGRWAGSSRFEGSLTTTHPRLRSVICSGVNSSLKSSRSFNAPQREVWDEVTRKLSSLKVSSATSSFHDLAQKMSAETERFDIDSAEFDQSTGMIVTAGSEILGLEYASSPDLFRRLSPRLLRGYALDALERRHVGSPASGKELFRFLSSISAMKPAAYPGVSAGTDLRFGNKRYVGRALRTDDVILQASFFPAVN
jgi:hypothetical protein